MNVEEPATVIVIRSTSPELSEAWEAPYVSHLTEESVAQPVVAPTVNSNWAAERAEREFSVECPACESLCVVRGRANDHADIRCSQCFHLWTQALEDM
jgi:hypothetical protein